MIHIDDDSKEERNSSSSTLDAKFITHGVYLNKKESTFMNPDVSTDMIKYLEPDIVTRMFYAQRYIEKQYEYMKKHDGMFKFVDHWLFKTLKINSLSETGDEYPKWENRNLSKRTTNWIVCVGLVTAEIMGAYLLPNSVSMLGYVPSNIMLIIFFCLTVVSGGIIWWVFMLLDSPEFPVKTFADIAYFIGGQPLKQLVILLQLIATILTCAVIIISGAQCVIILRDERMCWVGLLLLLSGLMMLFSLIKKLSIIGKYCLVITFINYIALFVQLGYIGHSEPNWKNALALLGIEQGTIETYAITPAIPLVYRVVAIANISYVFAGSVVFPEVISELKRPWEFWKSLIVAEGLILIVYLIFGNYIYAYQGQFSNSPSVFGVSDLKAMKGLSFIMFITCFCQSLVFGHVSCKIVYKNYIPIIIKTIKFDSKTGLLLWVIVVFLVWLSIFLIGAGVPQVSAVSAFTSALTMTPLTYVIPFLIHLYMLYKIENLSFVKEFVPFESKIEAIKFWKFVGNGNKKYWFVSFIYIAISLGAMALLGMGLWASVEYMKHLFAVTDATSFSCKSPI